MEQDFNEIVYTKLWKTRGARFVAHSNYLVQSRLSTFTIGILSAYVIVLSLFFLSPHLDNILSSGDLSLLTLTASLFTLIFSQTENMKNYKLKADRLHRNAMELSDIYHKAQKNYFSTIDFQKRVEIAYKLLEEYNNVIKKCKENHNDYDYNFFLAQQNNEENKFMSQWKANWIKLLVFLRIRYYYFLWLVIPLILFFILISG